MFLSSVGAQPETHDTTSARAPSTTGLPLTRIWSANRSSPRSWPTAWPSCNTAINRSVISRLTASPKLSLPRFPEIPRFSRGYVAAECSTQTKLNRTGSGALVRINSLPSAVRLTTVGDSLFLLRPIVDLTCHTIRSYAHPATRVQLLQWCDCRESLHGCHVVSPRSPRRARIIRSASAELFPRSRKLFRTKCVDMSPRSPQ